MTPELIHKYHLLNLTEYDMDQLRYRYGYLTQAFEYLKTTKITNAEWRAEALKLVDGKAAMIAKAKARKSVRKDPEVVAWLEKELSAARKALTEGN